MYDQNEKRKRMSCAIEVDNPCNISFALQTATSEGYHFIVTNLMHPHNKRDALDKKRSKLISRTDRILTSNDWTKLFVGKMSRSYQVDSEIDHVREQDEALLLQELNFACHLDLPAIMVKLSSTNNRNLAHILYQKMQAMSSYQIWIELPMTSLEKVSMFTKKAATEDSWDIWNELRRYMHYHKRTGIVLELPKIEAIPSDLVITRWLGEPVKALIIPTYAFLDNQHKQPVLPKAYQEVIRRFMALDVQYIIRGPKLNHSFQQYCSYMQFLGKKLYTSNVYNEFSVGCEDYLQNPLQPLSEHLENSVYEIFEKDPIKYAEYQKAIEIALRETPVEKKEVVIMIVGAGRGPLVQAALNAAYITGRVVRVYAIEKNPYAINTLEERIVNEWQGHVTLIHEDMRICRPPEDADILVSELLGSFGDNELSPECLDGAQSFLKKDGISIPHSYTSYLAPVQSTKLYNEILTNRQPDKSVLSLYETPYVVHLVNCYQIAQSQPLFTFTHPNWSERINNSRMKTLRFIASQNCVLTGFTGFFETTLYKDVMLSTNPQTHSPNMVSWFPILFSLPDPVQVQEGNVIEVTFWRAQNDEKVWYEWCLSSPVKGSIINIGGRSNFIKKN